MKKESLFTGFVLLVIFSLTSAGAKQEGEDYFPMSDGSRWEYSTKYCVAGKCNEGKLTSLIDGEETINGKKYYKAVTSGYGASEQKISYNRTAKDGVLVYQGNIKINRSSWLCRYPLQLGKPGLFNHTNLFWQQTKPV